MKMETETETETETTPKLKPSPAMAVALTALVVALAGTAIAAPIAIQSVLSKKEKKQAKNIANNQITARAPGLTVGTADNAKSVNDGAITTAKIADSAVRAAKLANVSRQTDSPNIPATTALPVDVDCDPGGRVVSGGWFISPGDNVAVTRSRQEDQNTWSFTFNNTDGASHTVDAIAVCISG